jgi:selenocysteine-specific elongation factor
MKNVVMGTAGHVDHGKTSLIKALTGIDTDRLKEEKERGITIELGFAFLPLSNERMLGIVDVPGHEKFIKNMVAGAAGIDFVMLVVAADEGIMPQTREHVDICSLLGIGRGLVALTKTDMVDTDWLSLVTDDVRIFLGKTFLKGAPIIPVSSLTGAGLPDLMSALETMAGQIEAETDAGLFRLPIDRVFTMKGFGTVVTGTLISGRISVGDEVEIQPVSQKAKIRGLQVHNRTVNTAEAGQRTAINLQGIDKDMVDRGDVLVVPGTFEPTRRIDTAFEYLAVNEKRLKNRTLVRFHTSTSEIIARVIFIAKEFIEPGEQAYAQLFLESPAVVMAGDRFVIRSYSPVTTIGGGVVIDPLPRKHKRTAEGLVDELAVLHCGDRAEKVLTIIRRSGFVGIALPHLIIRTGIHRNQLTKILDGMASRRQVIQVEHEPLRVVSVSVYETLQSALIQELEAYHKKDALKEGIAKEELRSTMGSYIGTKLFNMALKDLEKTGKIAIDKDSIRMSTHRVDLKGDMEDLRSGIISFYKGGGLAPPTIKEVSEQFSAQKSQTAKILNVMLREGVLVKISEDIYYHREIIDNLREEYKRLLIKEGKATPASFKELTGLSRKYIIPLMEYFDMTKLTIRAGEHRILREREAR